MADMVRRLSCLLLLLLLYLREAGGDKLDHMMVLAILLIGLTLEETLHLYSLALLEEIEECLVIILDPGLEVLDGRRGNLHPSSRWS